jgi:hypothetical protein
VREQRDQNGGEGDGDRIREGEREAKSEEEVVQQLPVQDLSIEVGERGEQGGCRQLDGRPEANKPSEREREKRVRKPVGARLPPPDPPIIHARCSSLWNKKLAHPVEEPQERVRHCSHHAESEQ